ncbi:hypothetical protein [Acrocarpospora sp. B8E8]|uniref:hypothetical protein n=1 Tax=Acrocarpospora sp. B8E8 TaxID=3153572 RepID=UPI00325C92B4
MKTDLPPRPLRAIIGAVLMAPLLVAMYVLLTIPIAEEPVQLLPRWAQWYYLGGITLVVAIWLAFLLYRRDTEAYRRALEQVGRNPSDRIQDRIDAVHRSFSEAATLMDQLRRDVEAQQAAREALIAQAEEQQLFLAVDQEQAERIRQILVGETKKTILAERRREYTFLLAGLLASIPIGFFVNWFS